MLMRSFFLNINNGYFINLFSIMHILLIILVGCVLFIVIKNKNFFSNLSNKNKRTLRLLFGILLIINMLIRRGSFLYYGVYDWHKHLDINFCNFTSIVFIIYSFTGNKKILNCAYYMSFIGPFIAILLPSTNLNPLGYAFYSFLLIHHIIYIFSFIFMFMEGLKWDNKNLWRTVEFLIIYFIVVFIFDISFGVNYNQPLTFVNNIILRNNFLYTLSQNSIIVYTLYFFIISLQLFIADKVAKKIIL